MVVSCGHSHDRQGAEGCLELSRGRTYAGVRMTTSMAWTQRCIPVSVSATSSPMSDLMLCYVMWLQPLFWIFSIIYTGLCDNACYLE